MNAQDITVGTTVKAFDPRTLGVVKHGRIVKVGRKYVTIDFGLTGSTRVAQRDVLELVEPALRCYCPDDCNCHYSWRPNYCGCRQHATQQKESPPAVSPLRSA